jgi:hypothetical protein
VPVSLSQFVFEYTNSEFIECSCEIARSKERKAFPQDFKKNAKILPLLNYIGSFLESIQKRYFLFGGTLIGWYRDCGIIPYTSDIDMGIFAREYESRIKKHFIRNKKALLTLVFGLRDDLYQLRINNLKSKQVVDLFMSYPFNGTHQMVGYHAQRKRTQ